MIVARDRQVRQIQSAARPGTDFLHRTMMILQRANSHRRFRRLHHHRLASMKSSPGYRPGDDRADATQRKRAVDMKTRLADVGLRLE